MLGSLCNSVSLCNKSRQIETDSPTLAVVCNFGCSYFSRAAAFDSLTVWDQQRLTDRNCLGNQKLLSSPPLILKTRHVQVSRKRDGHFDFDILSGAQQKDALFRPRFERNCVNIVWISTARIKFTVPKVVQPLSSFFSAF
jgi:hypothetical protein